MFTTFMNYVMGFALFALVCNMLHLDWQLMIMVIHDAAYGRVWWPQISLQAQ